MMGTSNHALHGKAQFEEAQIQQVELHAHTEEAYALHPNHPSIVERF